MEDQYIIGGQLTASAPAASGVWEGGGSGGDSGSDGASNTPVLVEIRPDEETTEPAAAEAAEAPAEDLVVVSILGGETTEATETLAVEAPVAADLTGSDSSGSWIIPAVGLAAVLVIGLVIGKVKRKQK